MIAFNDWFKEHHGEIPMDKSSKPPLQFTELSNDDIEENKKILAILLMANPSLPIIVRSSMFNKGLQLFYNAFK